MTRTVVIRKMGYGDTYIYLLRRAMTFTYLFSWKSEIYRQEVAVSPRWWRMLLWPFGCKLYSVDELEGIEKAIISGAVKSIDVLQLS